MNQEEMASTADQKRTARQTVRALRDVLSPDENHAVSERILSRLMDLPEIATAETIHTYIGSLPGEIETIGLIEWLLSADRTVLVPVVDMKYRTMSCSVLTGLSDLRSTPWGGLEPATVQLIDDPQIDVVIVPGLQFDRMGRRLGMGGGFYDAFLRTTDAFRIALAHPFQIVDRVPTDSHDERVHCIVTPDETIRVVDT